MGCFIGATNRLLMRHAPITGSRDAPGNAASTGIFFPPRRVPASIVYRPHTQPRPLFISIHNLYVRAFPFLKGLFTGRKRRVERLSLSREDVIFDTCTSSVCDSRTPFIAYFVHPASHCDATLWNSDARSTAFHGAFHPVPCASEFLRGRRLRGSGRLRGARTRQIVAKSGARHAPHRRYDAQEALNCKAFSYI